VTDFSIGAQNTDPGCTVLALGGELDMAGAPAMRTAGHAALGAGCSMLVLDVTDLTFVDSTGIGTWVELLNQAHQHGQRLVLRGVSDNLKRVLTIAGLVALFDLDAVPTPPDADPS
jgi:anti-sigma B factor antagonist